MLTSPRRLVVGLTAAASLTVVAVAPAAAKPFLDRFSSITPIASAVPASGPSTGDQNPYGVAVVPRTIGNLVAGDVLISNFNDAANAQGTGSSIMEISPSGSAHVFAVVPPPTAAGVTGLTTALVALRNGDVIVGNLPAPGGAPTNATSGALTVLDPQGNVVKTITAPDINGPWDMTAADFGPVVVLFVTNVLNGTVAADVNNSFGAVNNGTVARLVLWFGRGPAPTVLSNRVIATGFTEHLDPNALVVGPTGVGLGLDGTLFVADSANNRVAAVPNALWRQRPLANGGFTVSQNNNLNDPLGLAIAPNGNILTVNGADGNIVETTPYGQQVAVQTLVPGGAGDLFGLALAPFGQGVYFVNDAGPPASPNTALELLH